MKSLALTRPGRVRSTRWVTRARGGCPYALDCWPPLAAACEGSGDPGRPARAAPEIRPGHRRASGMPAPTGPIPGAGACQIQLTELALYQAVKVPLYSQGRAVTPLNAPVIEGRPGLSAGVLQPGRAAARAACAPRWCCRPGRRDPHVHAGLPGRPRLRRQQPGHDRQLGRAGREHRGPTPPPGSISSWAQLPGRRPQPRSPPAATLALDPRSTGVLKLVLVPVRYDADQSGRLPDVSEAQLQRYQDILMAYYPTRAVELTVHETVSTSISAGRQQRLGLVPGRAPEPARPGRRGGATSTTTAWSRRRRRSRPTAAAPAPPACRTWPTAANAAARQVGAGVGFAGTLAGETLVHEIGHQHGRSHTAVRRRRRARPALPLRGRQHRRLGLRLPEHAPALARRAARAGAQGLHGLLQPAMDQRLHLRRPGHPAGGGQRGGCLAA